MFPLYKNSSFNFKQLLLKLCPGSGRSCTVQPPNISSKQPCRFRLLAALSVQVCCRCGSALPLLPPSYALPSSIKLYQLVAPDENSHGYPGPPQASPAANPTIHHRLPSTHQQTANKMLCINFSKLPINNQPHSTCTHSPSHSTRTHSPFHHYHPTSLKLRPVITIIFIIIQN